jgi:hypothetical protein
MLKPLFVKSGENGSLHGDFTRIILQGAVEYIILVGTE